MERIGYTIFKAARLYSINYKTLRRRVKISLKNTISIYLEIILINSALGNRIKLL